MNNFKLLHQVKQYLLEGMSKEEIMKNMNVSRQLVSFCKFINKIDEMKKK